MAKDNDAGTHEDFHAEIDALKKDLHSLRKDLRQIADSAVEHGHKQWDQSMESVHQSIEEHPMATVAITFGVGLLAGIFLCRK